MARDQSQGRGESYEQGESKGRPDLNKNTVAAVETLEASGRRVQVIGRVVDGRLEIDQSSLEELTKKFPNADMAFVAVNAPFDPASDAAG
jgi:hypothetical protein